MPLVRLHMILGLNIAESLSLEECTCTYVLEPTTPCSITFLRWSERRLYSLARGFLVVRFLLLLTSAYYHVVESAKHWNVLLLELDPLISCHLLSLKIQLSIQRFSREMRDDVNTSTVRCWLLDHPKSAT